MLFVLPHEPEDICRTFALLGGLARVWVPSGEGTMRTLELFVVIFSILAFLYTFIGRFRETMIEYKVI